MGSGRGVLTIEHSARQLHCSFLPSVNLRLRAGLQTTAVTYEPPHHCIVQIFKYFLSVSALAPPAQPCYSRLTCCTHYLNQSRIRMAS